jgi:hypothetical protein
MIKINGKTYFGNNIQVINNKVIIDGKDVTAEHTDSKEISIVVEGNLDSLEVDCAKTIEVQGNVNSLSCTSGDVTCGNVQGNVKTTSGDVECSFIGGDVQTTSGDVKSNTITGSVKTMSGNIKHRK